MRALKHDKICQNQNCQKKYKSVRSDSKFCSSSCKAESFNQNKIIKNELPQVILEVTETVKKEVVQETLRQVNKIIDRKVEGCSTCNDYAYDDEMYHHKNKTSLLVRIMLCPKCQKSLTELMHVSIEEVGYDVERRAVWDWNNFNKYDKKKQIAI